MNAPDTNLLEKLCARLLPAVLEAGRAELAHFSAGVTIEKKADKSPVTVADREAEAILLSALAQIAPNIPVVAEEAAAEGKTPPPSNKFFLVDALDGTQLFIRGKPEFSINVALVENTKPVFGLIYVPPTGRLFVTQPDGFAYQGTIAATSTSIDKSSMSMARLSTRQPDPANLVAFNSRASGSASAGVLQALDVRETRPMGSAIKFGLVAAGEGDLYVRMGQTYEWDTAAGQAILEGAGGAVTLLDGTPVTYGHATRGYLNPFFIAWGRYPLAPGLDIKAALKNG